MASNFNLSGQKADKSNGYGDFREHVSVLFRLETKRQALLAIEIIDGTLETPDLIPADSKDGDLDRKSLLGLRETLLHEIAKLEANEATIAVIGAMKSGKSTTISAVIGTEVVPSRDKPMTTFPTILTHRSGKTEAQLTFPLAVAFEVLARQVKERLGADDPHTLLAQSAGAEELTILAKVLQNEAPNFPSTVSGNEQVRTFLVMINDLTRLARELEVPLDAVDEALTFKSVPRIEVEFEHLAGKDGANSGALSLIDTPGPDEAADSRRLEAISKEQLRNASAILLVLNYRLIGGETAEKIMDLLRLLPEGAEERTFVLVNQYDLRQVQGDDLDDDALAQLEHKRLEQTRSVLAAQIFGAHGEAHADSRNRIFPTSARQALRANQALRALRLDGHLPRRAWSREFSADVFALCGKSFLPTPDLQSSEGVTAGAKLLWDSSLFPEPLEKVIATSAQNASFLLVQACLDKLKGGDMAKLFDRLEIGSAAFRAKTDDLKDLVDNLSGDLKLILEIERDNRARIEAASTDLKPQLKAYISEAIGKSNQLLNHYLKTGNPMPADIPEATFHPFLIFKSFLDGLGGRARSVRDAVRPESYKLTDDDDPSDRQLLNFESVRKYRSGDTIEMSSGSEARELANKIFDGIEAEFTKAATNVATITRTLLSDVVDAAKSNADDSFNSGWVVIRDHIAEVLQVDMAPPQIDDSFTSATDFEADARERGASKSKWSKTVYDDNSGAFASAKRAASSVLGWFGIEKKWGRTARTVTHTDHYVEIGRIRDQMLTKSGKLEGLMEKAIDSNLENLHANFAAYAQEVRQKVERIHGYILIERAAREGDAEIYAELRDRVSALADQAKDLKQESSDLRREMQ